MRLYLGSYGHRPSGKMYSYWGSDNFRTGQNVVAPVTNKWTHKTYNTMFTIMRTSGANGQVAQNEAQRLSQMGIGMKMIKGTNVLEDLPSGRLFNSKSEWAKDSDRRYHERLSLRLLSRGGNTNTSGAEQRLLGESNG